MLISDAAKPRPLNSADNATDPVADLATEFAQAQAQKRRRLLVRGGIVAALVIAAVGALIYVYGRPTPFPTVRNPLLWRVVSADGQVSHMFGTMHVGFSIDDLPVKVVETFRAAQTLVAESDLLTRPEVEVLLEAPNIERFDDATWAQLSALTNIESEKLHRVPTTRLLGVILLAAAPRKRESMDVGFQVQATASGKPMVFLEHRDLDQIMRNEKAAPTSEPTQARAPREVRQTQKWVEEAIGNMPGLRAQLRRMSDRYAAGDTSKLGDPENRLGLLEELNDAWIDGLEREVRRGGAFVVVGVSHLVGADSLRERLRARGFAVSRVK